MSKATSVKDNLKKELRAALEAARYSTGSDYSGLRARLEHAVDSASESGISFEALKSYEITFRALTDEDLSKIKDLALAILTKRSADRRAQYQQMLSETNAV